MKEQCVAYGCGKPLTLNSERYEQDGNYCRACISKANRAKVERYETMQDEYAKRIRTDREVA